MTTRQKGVLAVLKAEIRANEKGFMISKPVTDACRYDLILDDGKNLYRVQVKYADGKSSHSSGVIPLYLKKKGKQWYGSHEIDAILAYLPVTDALYWIGDPVMFENKTVIFLRLEKPKNNQLSRILMVEDFRW